MFFLLYDEKVYDLWLPGEKKVLYLQREKNTNANMSIQDSAVFEKQVYDLIESYLQANDCTIYATDGVYVDDFLQPAIINGADAQDPTRFYPVFSLIREDDETVEADMELVRDWQRSIFKRPSSGELSKRTKSPLRKTNCLRISKVPIYGVVKLKKC